MPKDPKHFVVADPTTFDGNPYEVAGRAVRQAAAVAGVLAGAITAARGMVGNAEMERQLHFNNEADYEAFENSPLAKSLDRVAADAERLNRLLHAAAKAAEFDPKHPPKES